VPARNRIQICLDDSEMAYIERIAKVRRTSISRTARLCVQAGMRSDNDGLSVLLKMELAAWENRKAELEEELWKATKECDRLVHEVHDLEQIADQEHQAETTAPSRPIPSPSLSTTDDPKPAPAQTAEEHWRAKVGYVLNPRAYLLKEDTERVEEGVVETAGRHPDWLDALPKGQQAALREKMVAWKGRE